jgi:hypothetical protein
MNIRFDMCNVRSLHREGPLMTVKKEISKYKLDLVAVQEVRWDRGGTEPAGKHTYFLGKGEQESRIRYRFFCT